MAYTNKNFQGERPMAVVESLEGRRLFSSVAAGILTGDTSDGPAMVETASMVVSPTFVYPQIPALAGVTFAGTYQINGKSPQPFSLSISTQTGAHFSAQAIVTTKRSMVPVTVNGKTNRHGLLRFHGDQLGGLVVLRVHARLDLAQSAVNGTFTFIFRGVSQSGTVSLMKK